MVDNLCTLFIKICMVDVPTTMYNGCRKQNMNAQTPFIKQIIHYFTQIYQERKFISEDVIDIVLFVREKYQNRLNPGNFYPQTAAYTLAYIFWANFMCLAMSLQKILKIEINYHESNTHGQ